MTYNSRAALDSYSIARLTAIHPHQRLMTHKGATCSNSIPCTHCSAGLEQQILEWSSNALSGNLVLCTCGGQVKLVPAAGARNVEQDTLLELASDDRERDRACTVGG